MKQNFLLCLAPALAALALTACGGAQAGKRAADPALRALINLDGTLPIIREAEKFPPLKMFYITSPVRVVPVQDLAMNRKLAGLTGAAFDWEVVPGEGAGEKLNLMFASGSALPDAFWNGIGPGMVSQYLDQDIFLPTEGLIEQYMPRLRAILEKHPEYRAAATAPDGHMYGFPYIEEMKGLVLTPGPFIINTEWLRKVGKEMPATVDEFTGVLRAFRDAGDLNGNGLADEIPYSVGFTVHDAFGSYNTFHQFTGAFGQADSYCGGNGVADHLRVIDGRVVFTALDPAYRETARYFHMLNKEKLIDADSFAPGPNGLPLYTNRITGSEAVVGVMGLWAPANEITDPGVRRQYAALPRMAGPGGKTGFVLNFSEMQDTSMVAITTECAYPELIAAYVDLCYEPELSITLNWGAEGVIYEKGADGMLHFRLDADNNIKLIAPYKTFGELRENSTPGRGGLAVLNEYYGAVADYTWDAVDLLEGQIAGGKYELLAEYTPVPKMILTQEEQMRISRIQPSIADIVDRYTVQWVLDGNIDATWDHYRAELEAAGVADLAAAFQGAYERYLAAREKAMAK
ncbi:MAG: extracellular solute-binding protein [Treponema sp.]|jgi:putative aldouronate transport system substrate-binding protein|nr:extracellular solute-binding protein [Treponema sp.]